VRQSNRTAAAAGLKVSISRLRRRGHGRQVIALKHQDISGMLQDLHARHAATDGRLEELRRRVAGARAADGARSQPGQEAPRGVAATAAAADAVAEWMAAAE
jgi:hypothetical protein